MTTVAFFVCIALCLRSRNADGVVDADFEELFADEGGQSLSVVLKTWSRVVGCAGAGVVQSILDDVLSLIQPLRVNIEGAK